MPSKFTYRLSKIALSSIEQLEMGSQNSRCGIVDFNPKQKIDDLLLRVILVGNEEFKTIPSYIQAHRIIDYRGKFIVGEFLLSELKKLEGQKEIVSIDLPGPLYDDLQEALPESGWNVELSEDVRDRLGLETHWDGTGVLIGIIDSGIDYKHEDFRDQKGQTIIEWIFERSGREWTRNQINDALQTNSPLGSPPHLDARAHGTAVAACMASTGMGTGKKGVAPGASLLVMKPTSGLSFINDDANNGYLDAIVRLKNYMVQDSQGRPLVINLSQGENTGTRDGSLAFEAWLDQLLDDYPKIAFCKSAGNDGNRNHHANGNVLEDQKKGHPILRLIENPNSSTRFAAMNVQIGYDDSESMELVIIGPDGTESILFDETIPSGNFRLGFIFQNSEVNAFVAFEQIGSTKKYEVEMNLLDPLGSLPVGDYVFKLKTPGNIQSPSGNYHLWWYFTGFASGNKNRIPAFIAPHQSFSSTINAGAGGRNVFVVGAYDGLEKSLSPFSGKGPTRDGRLGVDLVAPGTGLITASANTLGFGASADQSLWSGTSFSCPIVSGALALLMQKEIALNGAVPLAEELKNRLRDFSAKDYFTGPIPNPNFGHGKLHVLSALYQLMPQEPHAIHIEMRPISTLIGQAVDCYVQLVDEIKRPVNQNHNFEIYRAFGSSSEFELIGSGVLETGGMLLALPAFENAGDWIVEVRIQSLNLINSLVVPVRQFSPVFPTEEAVATDYFETGVTFQYYFDGTDDALEYLEAFGFLLSGGEPSHHLLIDGVNIDYGYIDNPNFDFSDSHEVNLQAVNELTSEQGLSFEPSLYTNDVFKLPFIENFLFYGEKQFLLQLHFTRKIGTFPIKTLPTAASHVQCKQWVGSNFRQSDENNGKQAPVWIINPFLKATDVWLKSGANDEGDVPFIIPTAQIGSPDILIPIGFQVLKNNLFRVRVRNRGVITATGAQLEVFWSENERIPLNGDFPNGPWHTSFFFTTDGEDASDAGNSQIIDIEPDANFGSEDEFQTVSFIWNPPMEVLSGESRQSLSIITRLSHPDDPVLFSEESVETISRHNNISYRRFIISENSDIDLWFRANSRDQGSRDLPVNDNRQSPDILVRHSPIIETTVNTSEPLAIGRDNIVYLKLRHRNFSEQNNATVSLFWSTKTERLTPSDLRAEHIFESIGNDFEENNEQRIVTIPPSSDDFILLHFKIHIPEVVLPLGFDGKLNLIATVSHRNDVLTDLPSENSYATENNVARKVVEAFYPIRPWLRDQVGDTGTRPSVGDFFVSPDIAVYTETQESPFENPSDLLRGGGENHVYVQIRNAGREVARDVRVHLYWLPVWSEGNSEEQWISEFISTDFSEVNAVLVNEIAPKESKIVHFKFETSFSRNVFLSREGIYFIAKLDYEGNATPGLRRIDLIPVYDNVAAKKVFFRRNILWNFIAWLLRFFRNIFFGG